MNLVVIIKQVPEIELVRVDEASASVTLPSGPGIVNPSDEQPQILPVKVYLPKEAKPEDQSTCTD